MFNKKVKYPNKLIIHTNKLILLGCPCATSFGSPSKNCRMINNEEHPCITCPISSIVYIALAIKKEMHKNDMIALNMQKAIIMPLEMFPGKENQ